MQGALKGCRHVPGWERTFIQAILNGYNEKTAANAAGVGTGDIRHRVNNDDGFKKRYEEAWAKRKSRPAGGLY